MEQNEIVEKSQKAKRTTIISISAIIIAIAAIVLIVNIVILNNNYNKAIELKNIGQYTEAIAAFLNLNGYRDSNEQIYSIKSSANYISTLSVGETFYYGHYNDAPLEWTILDIQNNQIFAITTNAVDRKKYNDTRTDVTWSSCSLRTWLNNDFANEVFNSEEQSRIIATTVNPGTNPNYSTDAGNATEDKVFLLSIDEANQYFNSDESRMCEYDGESCWWWLRSPGDAQSHTTHIFRDGSVCYLGDSVDNDLLAVRPAFWINIEL